MNEIEEKHSRFLADLRKSHDAVLQVAHWLSSSYGFAVTINPQRFAPTRSVSREYSDNNDLTIQMPVEVKGLNYDFTSASDWPFGGDYIVCSKRSWDRFEVKPYCFISLNRARTHAGIVMSDTSPQWYVESRVDRRYNEAQDKYFCPLHLVHFVQIAP